MPPFDHHHHAPRAVLGAGKPRPLDADALKALRRRMTRRAHGVFQSRKMRAAIPWRHFDERDLIAVAELEPQILRYSMFPERVPLHLEGDKVHWHVPSMLAWTPRGMAVLDAMPARTPGREAIVEAVATAYAMRRVRYRALTGAEIRVEPRFRNCRLILDHRRARPADVHKYAVTEALAVLGGRATVGRLVEMLPNVPEVRATAFALVLDGRFAADLSVADPDEMELALPAKETVS